MTFRSWIAAALVALVLGACGVEADAEPVATPLHDVAEPWQPVPFAIGDQLLAEAQRICAPQIQPANLPLVNVDARGARRIWLMFAGRTDEADCMLEVAANGTINTAGGGAASSSDPIARPVGGDVAVWVLGTSGGPGFDSSSMVGLAGPNVAHVEIATRGGKVLRASLGPTGWFGGWWPGSDEFLRATGYDAVGNVTGTAQ